MCGIVGIVDYAGHFSPDKLQELTHKMRDTLRHRGPDDAGPWPVWKETALLSSARWIFRFRLGIKGSPAFASHAWRHRPGGNPRIPSAAVHPRTSNHLPARAQAGAWHMSPSGLRHSYSPLPKETHLLQIRRSPTCHVAAPP